MDSGNLEGGIVSELRDWVDKAISIRWVWVGAVDKGDMATMGWQGTIDIPRAGWGYEKQQMMKNQTAETTLLDPISADTFSVDAIPKNAIYTVEGMKCFN